MAGYVKVFDSLLTSSLWVKPHFVVRIWIAMLARCDSKGVVEGSVPGFASLCRVTDEEMREALVLLTGPDPDSRTPDHDGRRLEVVPGGWRILNYGAYRAKGQEKEGSKAPFMRALRERRREEDHPTGSGNELPVRVTSDPTANAGTDVPPTGVVPAAPTRASKPDLEPLRQEVLGHWRAVGVPAGLPDVLKGTVMRLQPSMNARLKDPEWLALFREAVNYAAGHPDGAWMRGQGERRWKVSLDWLLKPGKAEDIASKARATGGRAAPTPSGRRAMAADATTTAQVQQVPVRKLAAAGAP